MNKEENTNKIYDVIVIGGGASGMMAASVAAENGSEVLLIEKNKVLGKKLSITGGGRCNITNAEEDTRTLLSNYGKADKFLFSAFSRFGMQETIDYFESRGLPIKIEGRKRAFPVSNSAQDVVDLLDGELRKHNVHISLNSNVKSIYTKDKEVKYIQVDNSRLQAKKYILSTGGASKPETGSTGDGFKWLKSTGHVVNEPTPNVTPLAIREKWVKDISGVTAKDVSITFLSNGESRFTVKGSILFTHFGISGPTILNNAYRVSDLLHEGEVTASIDLYPDLSIKELDNNVISILEEHNVKQLKNTLRHISPPGIAKALQTILDKKIDFDTKNSELSRDSRIKLVQTMKSMPMNVEKLMGFEKAVVADGGLSLKDIDTRTMRSKKINNLYVTGDLLDINRPSGGFSLQLCWTTGFIAGSGEV